jgi:hypothetical protein
MYAVTDFFLANETWFRELLHRLYAYVLGRNWVERFGFEEGKAGWLQVMRAFVDHSGLPTAGSFPARGGMEGAQTGR